MKVDVQHGVITGILLFMVFLQWKIALALVTICKGIVLIAEMVSKLT